MAKQMSAGFRSRCLKCPTQIQPGEQIMYEKGRGSWHVTCPEKSAKTPAAPVAGPSVEIAPFVVYEKWSPCSGAAHQNRLAAVVGETRRYDLGPTHQKVNGRRVPSPRQSYVDCEVCGVLAGIPCSPPEGHPTVEAPVYIDGVGHVQRPFCVLPAVSAHEAPIPEARRRERLPSVREGASATAEEGVYVIVGAGKWRFQNAEDNEDMGDMQGANWSGPLFLRRATAEEAAADAARRVQEAMPRIVAALGLGFHVAAKRVAEAAMEAAATRPGYARAVLDGPAYLGLTGEEGADRLATRKELWHGLDRDYSYVCTWTWRGQTLWESHQYIYDWDQPTVYVGPAVLTERAEAAQAIVSWGWGIQCAVRRMEREAQRAA